MVKEYFSDIIDKIYQFDLINFNQISSLLRDCKGHIYATGVGKSGIIGQKFVSSLRSIGKPSSFINPLDASHGDLGTLTTTDLLVVISKSGNTKELYDLIIFAKNINLPVLLISENENSHFLSIAKSYFLPIPKSIENIPTISSTLTLILCDALVLSLTNQDTKYHIMHPGGSLGKKAFLVKDLMTTNKPIININDNIEKMIEIMNQYKLGMIGVMLDNELAGVITDGDIRRNYLKQLAPKDIMSTEPILTNPNDIAINALELMNKHNITCLPVCDNSQLTGFIHIHNCLKVGL